MKTSSVASLAAIAAILVVGSSYLTFGVVQVRWFQHDNTATMVVPDSGGLLPRSKVLLQGIQIGQVTSVEHTGPRVRVAFRYAADYRIPATSTARIESLSGLGEPYLEFMPSTDAGPYLRDGQQVDARTVIAPVSLPEVARTATKMLAQVDPKLVGAIIDNFTQAFAGTRSVIPDLSRSTDLLAATLLSRTAVIRQLLVDLQTRADDMWWAGPELTKASGPWAEFGPRVTDVADDIARVIRAGDAPDAFLTDTPEVIGLVPLINQIAAKINVLGPDAKTLLPLFEPFVHLATGVAGQIDLSALISQALHATSPDGALRLQLTVK
ncbi:MlaD family protein [Nocardia arthritidis]|uniref:MCE family protein n=1 Tax=Nocardia arthritidis TaxID=228602 RepID=A0A6G9YIN2_9NOCA|nr:MlaD family protein [Nocardia arthritidis]QIS13044.1 MCE family protein [Nocardia arthritidis]